jgi:glucose/arabinose dehydrogenase
LWATDQGSAGHDKLNLIIKGGNYGWPLVQGDEQVPAGVIAPKLHSGTQTWAPSGLAYQDGSFFFGGLRSETLFQAILDPGNPREIARLEVHFSGEYGRLRDVVSTSSSLFSSLSPSDDDHNHTSTATAATGQSTTLYVTTSNRDGRGAAIPADDLVLAFQLS